MRGIGDRDINNIRPVFEERYHKEVPVERVKFCGVDRSFKLDGSDNFLRLEIPEMGATVLRGCEKVSTGP